MAAIPASVPVVRQQIDELLDSLERPIPRAQDIRLAVTEACANAVVHAYPPGVVGEVTVTAQTITDRLAVTVRDFGGGIQPGRRTGQLGLGLPLIHALADVVSVRDANPGVSVQMEFQL